MPENITAADAEHLLTASAAGRTFVDIYPPYGLSAAAIVSLANRGVLPCRRDSSNRRLFSLRDLQAERERRRGRWSE